MSKYHLHEIEGALELFSSEPSVFRPSELYKLEGSIRKELERYNIYLVARRPRLNFISSTLALHRGQNIITGVVAAQVEANKHHFNFNFTMPFKIEALANQQYPYDYLRFWTAELGLVQLRLHDVLRLSEPSYLPHTNMFVEYVGQAFGEEGERDVVDRLIGETGKAGHGSLQKVLAEVNASRPDQEVHLLLYSFEYHKRFILRGGFLGNPEPKYSADEAPERFEQFFQSTVSRRTRIDLVEAALIRYFAPQYNNKYKKTFPTQSHKILHRLHELDVTGLAVSLSLQEHKIKLYSQTVESSDLHVASYSIVRDENRLSFFDLADPSNDSSN